MLAIDKVNTEELISFLKTVPQMTQLSANQLEKACHGIQKISHKRGQVVCQEGSEAKFFYIVGRGEYELARL